MNTPAKIAIIGAGGFGTAMGIVLSRNGHEVRLWGNDPEKTQRLAQTRQNSTYLPGVPIPEEIAITADAAAALRGADLAVNAVPTQHTRDIFTKLRPLLSAALPVLSLCKGLEQGTGLSGTRILRDVLGVARPVAALTGPSHAEEVALGLPTTVVVGAADAELARQIQGLFNSRVFRVYTSEDLIGLEMGGALKNVIAIAAGIIDGLGFGDNAKSGLLTRGLLEMTRYGVAAGARRETFYGLAGLGDLFTTCVSPHGRNRALGQRIGRGETLDDVLATTKKVAEGVWTTRSLHQDAGRLRVEMPITEQIHAVLFEGVGPRAAVEDLMSRAPRPEYA